MEQRVSPRWRLLTVIAQDPSVRDGKSILRARVQVPYEAMADGPAGYRVKVVDYDASSDTLLRQWQPARGGGDPFADATDAELIANPSFHQQNVYAIVMRTLAGFERALGRRVSWSFGGHQLKVIPHAFCDANAFYSKEDEALYFGYFPVKRNGAKPRVVFSCLSHDVVAHEATHALLDGLRARYTDPSHPDQAAFHEGFSDIVALLSVFSLGEVVAAMLHRRHGARTRIPAGLLTRDRLKKGTLFSLAEEMGREMAVARGQALRRSTALTPRKGILREDEFLEPHRRGEVLVAAVLDAMIDVWARRVRALAGNADGAVDLAHVVEEGCEIAGRLLTMCIRALDYLPPVHLTFPDYLSALVTADREVNPDDSRYHFRRILLKNFSAFGIAPASAFGAREKGIWGEPEEEKHGGIVYDRTHFEPMQRDADEVFRFIWENRKALRLSEAAYTRVQSVRPCVRVAGDGFVLRETVSEYVQTLMLMPDELALYGYVDPGPALLPRDRQVHVHGGGTLIFDEYGRLKFHIHNTLESHARQSRRILYLAESGSYARQQPVRASDARLPAFARLHLARAMGARASREWEDDVETAGDIPETEEVGHEAV